MFLTFPHIRDEYITYQHWVSISKVTSTEWNMFRDSSDGIEEYTTTVTVFINKCIDDDVPTVTIRTYPNQKLWIKGNIRTELKGRAAAFKERASNRQSVNVGLRSNHTTLAPTLVGCGRACKLLQTTKGSTAESCPVTQAYQAS